MYHTTSGLSSANMRNVGVCPTCLNKRFVRVALRARPNQPVAYARMRCHACPPSQDAIAATEHVMRVIAVLEPATSNG